MRWALLAAFVMLVAAGPALAQEVSDAPVTSLTQWVFVLVALVLTVMVVAVSFISSKRGHQD